MNHKLTALLASLAILTGGMFATVRGEEPVVTQQAATTEMTVAETGHAETEATDSSEAKQTVTAKRAAQLAKEQQLKKDDPFGGAITLLSMCIVVSALIILSILFLWFGRISSALQRRRKQEAHGPAANEVHEEADSGEVIAAIAAALAEHYSGKHDMEDYILTIRSMKRSYSPWNSKIYNLRVMPQIKHN